MDSHFIPPRPAIPVSFSHDGKYCENCGAVLGRFRSDEGRPLASFVHYGDEHTMAEAWPRAHGSYLHYAYWHYSIERAADNSGYYNPANGRWIGVDTGAEFPTLLARWPLPPWPDYPYAPYGRERLPDRFPNGGFYAANGEWTSITDDSRQPPPTIGPPTAQQQGRLRSSRTGCPCSLAVHEDEEQDWRRTASDANSPPSLQVHRRLCPICAGPWREGSAERSARGSGVSPRSLPPATLPPIARDRYPPAGFRTMNRSQLYWELERLDNTPDYWEWRILGGSIWSDNPGLSLSGDEQAWEYWEDAEAELRAASLRAAYRQMADRRALRLRAPPDSRIPLPRPTGENAEPQQRQRQRQRQAPSNDARSSNGAPAESSQNNAGPTSPSPGPDGPSYVVGWPSLNNEQPQEQEERSTTPTNSAGGSDDGLAMPTSTEGWETWYPFQHHLSPSRTRLRGYFR